MQVVSTILSNNLTSVCVSTQINS